LNAKAPNRVLDLGELAAPYYRKTIARMKALSSQEELSFLHPSKEWEYPWALSRAECMPGNRVLDAGCGASIFPVYLASQGLEVFGLDCDPAPRLDLFHKVRVGYLQSDLTALPFVSGSFDTVFLISVIEHLEPRKADRAMLELARILNKGGRLLLTTDYARECTEEMWYQGPGKSFRVDWSVFDRPRLLSFLERSSVWFEMEGELDLHVDWERTRERMTRFHGYPYTSVGVCLRRLP
jgi:SAM-dependent methyltransferase